MRRLLVASLGSAARSGCLKNSQKRFHWPSLVMPMKTCCAVRRIEDLVDRPRAHALGHGRRRRAVDGGDGEVLAHQEHHRFEERAFDQPALARAIARLERQHGAEGAEHAAHDVDDGRAGAQRPSRRAGHVSETAHHLHDFVQRWPLLVRPGQKAFQRAIDQPRVDLRQVLGPQPALGHRARREILDHHVGRLQELHQDRPALGRIGVERQALLVAVEVAEEAGAEAAQLPRAVAVDRFDLDHLGAEVGQDHAAGRAEDGVREFDDADAFERRCQTMRSWGSQYSIDLTVRRSKADACPSCSSPPSGGEEHEGRASLWDIPQDEACQLSMSLVSGRPAASPSTWWPMPAPTRNAS